jgi:3-phenylpropionate/cinnamic acid dioxygenase small subunit
MSEWDDFRQICDLKYRYAQGVDTRDWPLYRSIFADTVEIDFSSYNGRPPAGSIPADQWVAGVQPLFMGLAATQHSMTNPRVSIDGDEAEVRMYMQAEHIFDPDDPTSWFAIGGYYHDRARRAGDGWELTAVTLNVFWRRGRPEIMQEAVARSNAG